jgi:PAS domain S-box-containing protein
MKGMKKSSTSKNQSKTEIALKESERKFRETVTYLDEGYYSVTVEGLLLDHNQAFNRILGIDIDKDMKGAKLPDFWQNPDDRKVYLQELKTSGFIKNYLANVKTISDEKVVVMINSHMVKDEKGGLLRIEGTFTDYTERKQLEEDLKDSEVKYRTLFENAQVGMYRSKIDGTAILAVNRKLCEIFDYSESEMLDNPATIRWANNDARAIMIEKLRKQGYLDDYEMDILTKSEEVRSLLISVNLYPDQGYLEGTAMDITDRKRAEEQLRKLNRIYSLLSDINQAIVRTQEPKELFEKVCNIAVGQGGFGMVWIGLIDELSQKLQVIAQAGRTNGYIDQINISLNGKSLNYCPVDSALRQGKHIVCNIIEREEMAPCQKIAYELGFRSSASFPLKVSDIIKGAVTFYSDEPEFFDKEELKLLDELALDISFAMDYAEKEAGRKRAQELLRESEEKFRGVFDSNILGTLFWDANGDIISANDAFLEIVGYSREDLISGTLKWKDLTPLKYDKIDEEKLKELENRGKIDAFEKEYIHKCGRLIPIIISAATLSGSESSGVAIILDITHRKQVEEALKTSEERFRTAAESLTDVVFEWDIKEKVDWFGDIDSVMGYPPGEFPRTMEGWAATIHTEDKDSVLTAVEDHLKGVAPYLVEYRVGRRDGKWRWWSARGTALRNNQGEPYKMIGSITDITERRLAEETLRESEARYRTLVENIPQGIFMKDQNYRWVSINENFARRLGVSPNDVVGKVDRDLFPGDIADKYHADDIRIMETGQTDEFEEESILDGKNVWVNTIKTPVRDKKGEIVGLLGIFWDITERKQAEESLKISKERLLFATEGANLGIWNWNIITGELIWSDQCKALFGVPPDETMSYQRFSDALHPDDRERTDKAVKDSLDNHKDYDVEYRSLWPDGSIHWLAAKGRGFYDATGKAVRLEGIVLDIAESKRTEEEIRKLNAELEDRVAMRTSQLEASFKELEAFSYSVSHDLRAPLRHVSGYVELLNKRFQSDLPEKGKHYLNSIADSVHLMGVLIDDLLQFSRTGRMEMVREVLDMNEIVQEVKESISKDNPDRKIEWAPEKLPSVYGDEAMLRLVWMNLLSNAVKFTRTRKKARIEIGVRKENKELVFFVRDNGVGFDMQYAQKLFGVFQRMHPSEEFEGTGIGLANVHRIVLRHGGRTWAEAEPDKGAVFYFSIPKK